ncbi:cysteine peptidase family C39 domain-containing protein [Algisphaera agarilytica]|uniref:Putative double-glycine peptidase n=1 Tax=Algisphaera agarilytica TaxID=1385975 RepID=A0A7X0LLB5_9BACT|nr:cysteine peptidase family C39 domain-containing protein [Algisphaera agarilytica]MBB6431325.1 putative double-glycine peptidase [Algisphaera agarilytica]
MSGTESVIWFIGIALFTVFAWWGGVCLGRGHAWVGRLTIVAGIGLILAWGWLIRHPATAVSLIPVGILSRIEGVGGVPLFMMVLGAAWARCEVARQRVVIGWAMMFGAIYFVNGGMWMLQETPASVMGQTVSAHDIRQSQDYSCVPAACATALNLLEIPSTEKEMAELTQTRPGTGATMIRALDGLERRLRGGELRPILSAPRYEELSDLPMPLLTPLQFEATRQHMVVIVKVTDDGVWFMDPMDGYQYFVHEEFSRLYRNQVIEFRSF